MNEVLQSVRMVKFFNWEQKIEDRIMVSRKGKYDLHALCGTKLIGTTEETEQLRHNFVLEVLFDLM
jgi:hypothetical protein